MAVYVSTVPAPYSRNPEHIELGEEHFDMANSVTVAGQLNRPMGGLKESLKVTFRQAAENADALLNVTEGLDKDDPRPAYVPQYFPRMVYHAEHGEKIVKNEDELQEAFAKKYRREPYPAPQIVVHDPKVEKAEMERKNKEMQGQMALMADALAKANARLDAVEAAPKGKKAQE